MPRFKQLDALAGSVRFTAGGQFSPTLVIGLGGSGTNTARRVKRIQDQRYGRLGILRYLFADTDQAAYAPMPDLADADPAEQASLVAMNALQIHGEMRRGLWPQVEEFLPPDVDVGILRNADGAGGIRPVGRFALFSQFQPFYNQSIVRAAGDVLNIERLVASALGGVESGIQISTAQPRVYIVNSICGGTGSSVFLDVALLTRQAFRQSQVEPAIIGLFFLPSVFRNERGIGPTFAQNLLANGYAGLMELEFFSDPRVADAGWAFEYPGLGRVAVDGPLFDECYLVEGTNAQGQQLATKDEVFEMAARSALRNTSAVVRMHPCPETGKLRLMNSLATTGLKVPVEAIARHGSLHAARRVIHDFLLGSAPPLGELEAEVARFLSSNRLEERREQDMLLDRLLADADGNTLDYRPGRTRQELETEADAQGHRGERAQARYAADWLAKQVAWLKSDGLAQARATVAGNWEPALHEATGAVRQQLGLHAQERGLAHAQAWLEELVRIFTGVVGELTEEGTAYEETQRVIEQEVEQRRQFLADYGSLVDLVLRAQEDERAMERGLQALQRYGSAATRQVARLGALDLLNRQQPVNGMLSLVSQLGVWLEEVKSARAALEKAEGLIAGELDHRVRAGVTASTYVLEQHLVAPSQYEEHCRDAHLDHGRLAREAWQQLGGDGVAATAALAAYESRPEELTDRVAAAAAGELMRFLEGNASVMQVIQRQKSANETEAEYIRRQMRLMFAICQPFWTTRAPAGQADYERYMAITVPARAGDPRADAVRQAVAAEVRDAGYTPELVDADYPFALEISARAYGGRAYYLGSTAQMRVQYDAKLAQPAVRSLLHVDRRFALGDRPLPKLHPEPQEQARLLFAWAIAYGYIAKRGDYYYLGIESRLANGHARPAPRYETDWKAAVTDLTDPALLAPPRKNWDSADQLAQGRARAMEQFVGNARYVDAVADLPAQYAQWRGTQQVVDELGQYLGRLEGALQQTSSEELRGQLEEERRLLFAYAQRLQGLAQLAHGAVGGRKRGSMERPAIPLLRASSDSLPHASPTLVLGIGAALRPFLAVVAGLLADYQPALAGIARLGIVNDGRLEPLPGEGTGGEEELSAAIADCLYSVLTERNLEAARATGMAVGIAGGRLVTRVLVVMDGAGGAEIDATLAALRAAAAAVRQPLPLRLTCVVLTTGVQRAQVGFPLRDTLARARSEHLEPVNVVLLDRFRSDGSCLGDDGAAGVRDVRQVLAFLLFASLLPAAAGDHWLFQSPTAAAGDGWRCHTLGIGVLVVPLPAIEAALAPALLADLLTLLEREPDPAFAGPARGIEAAFAESDSWESLFREVPVVTLPGLGRAGSERLAVDLLPGEARLELDDRHWKEWIRLLAEFDARWGMLAVPHWFRQMEANAAARLQALGDALTALLDGAIREGQGAFPLAAADLKRARSELDREWVCAGPRVDTSVPDPDLAGSGRALAGALAAMPNGWALGARCFLVVVLEAYFALAVARAGWAAQSLPAAAAAGFAGVGLILYTGWTAARQWSAARARVLGARDDYLAAVGRKYAGVLRSHAILILRELRRALMQRVSREEERLAGLERRFGEAVAAARSAAECFAPPASPMVRPVVASWQELRHVAVDLWGDARLKPWLQAVLAAAAVTRWSEAVQLSEAGVPAEPPADSQLPLAGAPAGHRPAHPLAAALLPPARRLLVERLLLPRARTLGYYCALSGRFATPEAAQAWLATEVDELYRQGSKLLWTRPVGVRQLWQLLPADDSNLLLEGARRAHPEAAEVMRVPGVLGTLSRQEVEQGDVQQ